MLIRQGLSRLFPFSFLARWPLSSRARQQPGQRRHTGSGGTSDSVPNFLPIHCNPLPENPNRPPSLSDAQQFRHKYRLIERGRKRTRRSSARRNEAKPFVSFRLRQGGSFLRRKKVTEPPLRHSLPSPHLTLALTPSQLTSALRRPPRPGRLATPLLGFL